MTKFPTDVPKTKVIQTLQQLGFEMVREREHIAMLRINSDGSTTPLTLPNHPKIGSDAMWVIIEALANCWVRPNLRGL